jgi:hypothetical protein
VRPNTPDEGPEDLARRRVVVGCARLLIPPYVLYIASVGGDFLDLYRFLVPLLPLAFVAVASAGVSLAARVKGRAAPAVGAAVLVAGVGVLAAHAVGQGRTGTRALQVAEPTRAERGIEPLGWTRLFALRWAAAGRWIAERSHPEDWMAVGAAGAMPFYSGIQNLDTLGLCDAYVSHHGEIVGNRPGHQRFASHAYILSKHPVYIFVGDSLFPGGAPGAPPRDGWWESQGYVWTDLTVGERYGAPELFVYRVLVRRDRAVAMANDPDVRLPPGVVP